MQWKYAIWWWYEYDNDRDDVDDINGEINDDAMN